METLSGLRLAGETGKLLKKLTDNWLVGLRESNPAILDIFRDRDVKPSGDCRKFRSGRLLAAAI